MTRKCKASSLSKVALIILGIMGSLSQACYGAAYATVYNVVDYGADPTGTHDSSTAVTNAISAAGSAAQPGGTIYFPAGTFAITGAVAANMRQLNIVGSGVNATSISVSSTGSLTLSTGAVAGPYHFGAIKDFTLNCTPAKFAAGSVGVITQDVLPHVTLLPNASKRMLLF
jgi:Pectate lyase superfamily protein